MLRGTSISLTLRFLPCRGLVTQGTFCARTNHARSCRTGWKKQLVHTRDMQTWRARVTIPARYVRSRLPPWYDAPTGSQRESQRASPSRNGRADSPAAACLATRKGGRINAQLARISQRQFRSFWSTAHLRGRGGLVLRSLGIFGRFQRL